MYNLDDNAGRYIMIDGELYDVAPPLLKGRTVYEVVRIIHGVPLFFEDHFERLDSSIRAGGIDTPSGFNFEAIKSMFKRLISLNEKTGFNIKISFIHEESGIFLKENNGSKSETNYQLLLYVSKSWYPPASVYSEGVKTVLLELERKDPNVKLLNKEYKDAVLRKITDSGCFEAVLYDHSSYITEGSKSNIFFTKQGKVYTAPGNTVLKGITRKYVIKACENAGYVVVEKMISIEELESFDGAFLSGTSIKVLPVSYIGDVCINSPDSRTIMDISRSYENIIQKYIEDNVNIW